MSEQALRTAAIQKSLGLSEQDALKVHIFITGMQAGKNLELSKNATTVPDVQHEQREKYNSETTKEE